MSAQPVHHATPTSRVPDTVKGIRRSLPDDLRARFDEELGEAVDSGDMAVVQRVKLAWWGTAHLESDPQLKADLEALGRGELELFPSPFKR